MKLRKLIAMGLAMTMVLGTTGCGINVKFNPMDAAFVAKIAEAAEDATEIEIDTTEEKDATGIEGYETKIRDLGEMLAEAEAGTMPGSSLVSTEEIVEGDTVASTMDNTFESALESALQNTSSSSGQELGVITGNVYESAKIGLKFTAPEGYYMAVDEMAMMNGILALAKDAEGGSGKFMDVPIPESIFNGNYVMKFELLAMEENGGSGNIMIYTIQTDDTAFFVDVMTEQGGEKVSKWGQEWLYARVTEEMGGVQTTGDNYCLEMDGTIYMITIVAGDAGIETLLNAFEQI